MGRDSNSKFIQRSPSLESLELDGLQYPSRLDKNHWHEHCFDNFATTAVLLPLLPANNYAPRVLLVGASQPQIMDLSAGNPVWQDTSPRALSGSPARKNGNAVLLPDGTVLAVGGSETKLDADAVLAAERYDPATGTWSVLANSAVPRLYHSVALLLPDGRVWTAGSNFDCEGLFDSLRFGDARL